MADDVLRFDDYRRGDDVPCARCGKIILSTVTRCPECGVHFQGEAYDFIHQNARSARGGLRGGRGLLVVALLVAALLLAAVASR